MMPPAPPQVPDTLLHGRAIAGAKALHAAGHISAAERDRHIHKSRGVIRAAKGAMPMGGGY